MGVLNALLHYCIDRAIIRSTEAENHSYDLPWLASR